MMMMMMMMMRRLLADKSMTAKSVHMSPATDGTDRETEFPTKPQPYSNSYGFIVESL